MSQTDIANIDESIAQLPSDIIQDIAEQGKTDLFFFAKGILGYKDMTERCHMPLTVFFDSNPSRFKLALMPRDHFKSSVITTAGNMQKAIRDPEKRILIANESATNAERFLSAIKQHCESNRVFRTLYGGLIPDPRKTTWSSSALTLKRQGVYPEPTFDTIGMTGAFTSRHYTDMTFDDPISEEAIKSEKVMQDTIERLSSLLALLSNPSEDHVWWIGTRWAMSDTYSVTMKKYGGLLARFIRGAIEDGEPIFPERFDKGTLALMRADMGEYKFSCLMMNNPRDEALQNFNDRDVRFWRWTNAMEDTLVLMDQTGEEVRRVALDDLSVTCTVDLAPAETVTSDRNAVTVTGITPWNEAVVLEAWGDRCTPIQLMEKLFAVKQRWHPRTFGIESVAYQKAFKYFLREEARRRGTYINVTEIKASGKKEVRIRGLQPVAAVGRLYIPPEAHMLRQEMVEFPLSEHDDVLDSLSMHLQLWRGVLSPEDRDRSMQARKRLLKRMRHDPGAIALPNGRFVARDTLTDDDLEELEPSDEWEEVRYA